MATTPSSSPPRDPEPPMQEAGMFVWNSATHFVRLAQVPTIMHNVEEPQHLSTFVTLKMLAPVEAADLEIRLWQQVHALLRPIEVRLVQKYLEDLERRQRGERV